MPRSPQKWPFPNWT
ncbi:hypothetical protein F383_33735 [Gossypium arboreum]|uniref:Uncharacterized protein n=1 Tax=Gossypium arboreum TaxID=29729 RepID=A0A0B0PTH4_GOSAR|nr:hypothetical protein F383_31794 [Gossypium arboreum]KHG26716.1 hypothetical protein F383_33735 [Gossypium arboreum]